MVVIVVSTLVGYKGRSMQGNSGFFRNVAKRDRKCCEYHRVVYHGTSTRVLDRLTLAEGIQLGKPAT
jgi:hypothetical protein